MCEVTRLKSGCWHSVILSGCLKGEFVSAHSGCWQKSIPCNYRMEVLVFLLPVNWGPSWLPEANTFLGSSPPFSTFKPATAVSPSHTLSDLLLCFSLPLLRACVIRWGPLGSSRLLPLISGQLIRNLSSLLSCNIFMGSLGYGYGYLWGP